MISIESFFAPGEHKLPVPANGNLLGNVRPLTGDDLKAIIEEHGTAIGAAIDQAGNDLGPGSNKALAFITIIWNLPELQRWIVWYGANLKSHEVDALSEHKELPEACLEVMCATRGDYTDDAFRRFFSEHLSEFSGYVANGGLR
jgi:hypothetical protein